MKTDIVNRFWLHRYNDGWGMEFVCKQCQKPITFPGSKVQVVLAELSDSNKRVVQTLNVESVLQFHLMECDVYQDNELHTPIPWNEIK